MRDQLSGHHVGGHVAPLNYFVTVFIFVLCHTVYRLFDRVTTIYMLYVPIQRYDTKERNLSVLQLKLDTVSYCLPQQYRTALRCCCTFSAAQSLMLMLISASLYI